LFSALTYRKAVSGDVMLVYNWANDPLSRANSYFSEPIALETHKSWFGKKLADKNCSIYIAEMNGTPAGLVRYEVSVEHAVAGILLDQAFRGSGLAVDLLKDTAKNYFKEHSQPILAYIKQENTASVRSFEKAGYKKVREEVVHGCNSFVYELTTNQDITH
jgi:RimJ/RimL family protein N-acetyltransferase